MLRRVLAAVLMVVLAAVAGCQVRDEVWINPDGSGKVVHAMTVSGDATAARTALEGFMTSSGVEVVTDPAIKTANGETTVSVTGYFKDFSKVRIGQGGLSVRPEISVGADGTLTLKYDPAGAVAGRGAPAGSQPPPPTAEQIDAEVKNAQTQINQQLNGGMFGDMMKGTQTYVFHLPAAPKSVVGFKTVDAQTVTLVLEGSKAKAALMKLAADTATLRKMVEAAPGGRFRLESPGATAWIMKEMFGVEALTAVVAAGGKAAFDYKAEVGKAKPLSAQSMLETGVMPKDPPAGTMKFTEFKLANANTSASFGQARTFFNFEGTLPAGVNAVPLDTEYYVVVDDKGNYYVPGGKVNRIMSFGGSPLAAGAKVTPFISVPVEAGATKLARVAGVVNMATYTAVKDVDLGVLDLKEGTKGSQLGFVITSASSTGSGNGAMGSIAVETDKSAGIGAIKFIDPALEYPPPGGVANVPTLLSFLTPKENTGKRNTTLLGKALPEKARVVITVYEGYKVQVAPFELKDLDVPPAPPPASAPGTRP